MRRALVAVATVCLLVALSAPVSAGQGPSRGLRLVRTLHSLTGTHRWYVQTYGGHDVLGSYYAVHLDTDGRVASVADGREAVSGAIPATARISAAAARAKATVAGASADLVVLPGSHARLAWSVIDDRGIRTLVDATTGAVIRRTNIAQEATGTGRVFDPNPVVTLQDETLRDHHDKNFGALDAAYRAVVLTNLDGTGYLKGDFADVDGTHGPAFSPDLSFKYMRSNPWFEQVMSYYDITGAERYIQSLGFSEVNNEPQDVRTNTYKGDNSFYIPSRDLIVFGKGGVDDAEDAEVIWHEYGHAIQDAQVPGFGHGHDAGSIGEGFGDYWAVTMSQPVSNGFHVPCVMDWDSTYYTTRVPHCLRRVDTDLTVRDETGEVHHDGEIWSRALWDIHRNLGPAAADTIILEGQFSFAPDTSFADAAQTLVSTARALYGRSASGVVKRAFEARGIL